MTVLIKPTGFALGAEVVGADLTKPLDDTTFAQIRAAFYKHEVLYFRGQALSDEDHIRFTARFGELRQLKLASQSHVQHAEIYVISNIMKDGKHIGSYDAGVLWHTDGAYLDEPPLASVIRAIEVPIRNGRPLGDTEFASMSAAYDALDESMKKRLEGLHVHHSIAYSRMSLGFEFSQGELDNRASVDASDASSAASVSNDDATGESPRAARNRFCSRSSRVTAMSQA